MSTFNILHQEVDDTKPITMHQPPPPPPYLMWQKWGVTMETECSSIFQRIKHISDQMWEKKIGNLFFIHFVESRERTIIQNVFERLLKLRIKLEAFLELPQQIRRRWWWWRCYDEKLQLLTAPVMRLFCQLASNESLMITVTVSCSPVLKVN